MYVNAPYVCNALGGQERVLDSLKLKLEMVVSHDVGRCWEPIWILWRSCKCCYCSAISLGPTSSLFLVLCHNPNPQYTPFFMRPFLLFSRASPVTGLMSCLVPLLECWCLIAVTGVCIVSSHTLLQGLQLTSEGHSAFNLMAGIG